MRLIMQPSNVCEYTIWNAACSHFCTDGGGGVRGGWVQPWLGAGEAGRHNDTTTRQHCVAGNGEVGFGRLKE